MQCIRPAPIAGQDDIQANLDACKGRVPKQKEECVGKRIDTFFSPLVCKLFYFLSIQVNRRGDLVFFFLEFFFPFFYFDV